LVLKTSECRRKPAGGSYFGAGAQIMQ
jgi:hypothetical protein